ncbi:uncharacterized protein Tco025E_05191 [Trypanosoma conorhini]|uniref:Uncharacterized protein n=1 Tax=Trypanosoma conorhini TaxID=83891 RepID=A0A422PFD5_9TRYP|nr:uncharacterized protein Tco025E_05191 [Trypanosoma conorhini]RNF16425.1 hypothetical protein Tco025E_05191 [Trypanosoma conorhini]
MQEDYAAPLLTRGEFEAIKHDPLLILERGTAAIVSLQQDEAALKAQREAVQLQLQGVNTDGKFNSQRYREAMDATAELERDHRTLSVRCIDAELGNKRLAKVVDELREEKEALREELQTLRGSLDSLAEQHADAVAAIAAAEKAAPEAEAKGKGLQEAIAKKIDSLDALTKEIVSFTNKSASLQRKVEKLGCERLVLEAETVALEQTTLQQERTINYLQYEAAKLGEATKARTSELVEAKKQTAAMLLELQLQVTRAEEEMTRLHNAVANEKSLTGRQNIWQAKELHAKTEDLLTAHQELARERGGVKAELAFVQEKMHRLQNNVLVVEKQNQVLNETLRQLEEEDELLKANYNKRKKQAVEEMTKQSAIAHQLNAELEEAREKLYLLNSKVCKACRSAIFTSEPPSPSPRKG